MCLREGLEDTILHIYYMRVKVVALIDRLSVDALSRCPSLISVALRKEDVRFGLSLSWPCFSALRN